jgi:hypothetical protein
VALEAQRMRDAAELPRRVPLAAHERLATLLATLDGVAQDELPDVLGLLEAAKARCWARLTAPAASARARSWPDAHGPRGREPARPEP